MLIDPGRARRWIALVLTSVLLTGCASSFENVGGYTGEEAATDQLERVQVTVVSILGRWPRDDDPVDRARRVSELSHPLQGPNTAAPAYAVLVEPLDWRAGAAADVVDVRLRVDAAEYIDPALGGRSWGAGTAERCLRVEMGRSGDDVVDTIGCAGRTARPLPPYVPPPPLDDAARATLAKAMRRSSFAEAEQAAVQAFPRPHFAVVAEVIDGTWAVVVVRPTDYECVGATRTAAGIIEVASPDRRQMQPGEGGCDPVRFVRPI